MTFFTLTIAVNNSMRDVAHRYEVINLIEPGSQSPVSFFFDYSLNLKYSFFIEYFDYFCL